MLTNRTIAIAADSDVGVGGRWMKEMVQEWAANTGNKIAYIGRPNDATATLQQFQQYWAARSGDIDVYMIDVIWAGIAAPYAVDLKKYFKPDEIEQFFPRIINNNTAKGKLVAMPLFADAGLLYYRTDLLAKYGFKEPPKTWEELAQMAQTIQAGERRGGNSDFQGFVFEGKATESVTCNALEWIYSYGGGTIVEADGKVSINNQKAIHALETAKSWMGTISPQGVVSYGEEDARNVWQAGNAAFMRNWPYAYLLGEDGQSPISGKFAITVLPKGGIDGKNAACLGGWQLMVSAFSKNQELAADLVRYLVSNETQKKRTIDLAQWPTLPQVYQDVDVLAKYPWFANVPEILNNSVARPATIFGADYGQISTACFQNVNKVLLGAETGKQAVTQIEKVAKSQLSAK